MVVERYPDRFIIENPGTLLVSGYYGDALTGDASSTVRLFRVLPQDTIDALFSRYQNVYGQTL